jgi:HK97 family phage major capsid protein
MSTQLPPVTAPGASEWPFKTQEEFSAFLKRVVVEEAAPAMAESLKALTEAQTSIMRDMVEAAATSTTKWPAGIRFARMARATALAQLESKQTHPDAIKHAVKKHWGGDDEIIKGIDGALKLRNAAETKATAAQAGDAASLGNIIIPEYSREWIQLLRNRTIIRRIARVIPNPTGSLTLRRQTTSGTAYWVGEGTAILPSKPGTGLMNFLRKKLAGITIMSNDLARFAGPEADEFVLDDMLRVNALAEDLAFIRADGTEFTPKGIRNLVSSANVFAQTGTTLATVDADFAKAARLMEEANVEIQPGDLHWLMVPRTWFYLWNLAAATDTGARPYREELRMAGPDASAHGNILSHPVHKTNQIPKNLGGGGNESETYCVHGPSLWIADTLNVQVDVFPGGAYEDGGVVVSGISRDETPIRVLRETDFNMRHTEAGAVITGVTLGA